MKVLVIGNGAREHAICHKLKQSKSVKEIYCAPGNGGISQAVSCIDIKVDDLDKITEFSVNNKIDLVVIGPELPLVLGLTDMLKEKGIKVFGPDKRGARLEGSKSYSKEFMKKYNIPTAKYEVYASSYDAKENLNRFNVPVVVKADGLAAGKGVLICETIEEAKNAIDDIMTEKKFGEAGNTVVIEEFLDGIESSLLCFADGSSLMPMESAKDYKKASDGDKGLNTGGMGCFSPNPVYTDELKSYIKDNILETTLKGFKNENIDFKGVLFIGLMIKDGKAKVLEYNTRFGDPETEVILPRLKSDLAEIMLKCIDGGLREEDLRWTDEKCVTVVLASGGYPEKYETGKEITGFDRLDEDITVFHGGTKAANGKILTDGGRVLAVTAIDETIEKAREKVYKNIERIEFEGMQYRKDIGRI
ncbi:phosphoribosylamine--glycine ligase [Sedimentibacter sp.]|uniref:phosphoribosylamine--glycine ligase n=1 Tax=Sedimentibacter sp. TaxID=1960295 RepID=UPI00289A9889|nr:phosphoribosylamine--glycine ligase [Sedimentibacter sp.]